MPKIEHQYAHTGGHRVVVDGVPGPWEAYQHPAFSHDQKYMAVTDYYVDHGAVYSTERITDFTKTEVCRECDRPYKLVDEMIPRSSACVHVIAAFPALIDNAK